MIPKHSYSLWSKSEIQSDINMIKLQCQQKYESDWYKVFPIRVKGHFIDKIKEYYDTQSISIPSNTPLEQEYDTEDEELLTFFKSLNKNTVSLLTQYYMGEIDEKTLLRSSSHNRISIDYILGFIRKFQR